MSDELIEFLRARLAEREAMIGRANAVAMNGIETVDEESWYYLADPDWAQADVAAKRAIIEAAEEATYLDIRVDGEWRVGRRDTVAEPYVGDVILRAMALPYADHPDCRPEWRTA